MTCVELLRSFYGYSILSNCSKFGFSRQPKKLSEDDSKILDELLDQGLVLSVPPTDEMLKHVHFTSEERKKEFIDEFYFLISTDKGKMALEFRLAYNERVREDSRKLKESLDKQKYEIASSLLESAGISLEEIIERKVNSEGW